MPSICSVMDAFCEVNQVQQAQELAERAIREGLVTASETMYNTLIKGYARCRCKRAHGECGCTRNEGSVLTHTGALCLKTESFETICRVSGGTCPGDMTLCSPATLAAGNRPPSAPSTCADSTVGKYAKKKRCARKVKKGKCHKKKVRTNCRHSCGLCNTGVVGAVNPPPPPPPPMGR